MLSPLKMIVAASFFVMSLAPHAPNAAEGQLDGFGKIKFGMTWPTVLELLGDQITQYEARHVGYRTSVQGHPVYVFQYFDVNRSLEKAVATKADIRFGATKTVEGGIALFGRALKMLQAERLLTRLDKSKRNTHDCRPDHRRTPSNHSQIGARP